MQWFFLAVILLCLLLLAGNSLTRANPQVLARYLRLGGGIAMLGVAVFLLFIGRFGMAAPLVFFAMMLLRRRSGAPRGFGFPGGQKSSGQDSRVRSNYVEMILDHDTGDIDGGFLRGEFAGKGLAELNQEELVSAYGELCQKDPQGAQLLQAYLDRRFPDWDEGADRGAGEFGGGGPITRDEAYEILGLGPGAAEADIRAAHRRLMKKLHPDQGGSTVLAAKVNQAKDFLLGLG